MIKMPDSFRGPCTCRQAGLGTACWGQQCPDAVNDLTGKQAGGAGGAERGRQAERKDGSRGSG